MEAESSGSEVYVTTLVESTDEHPVMSDRVKNLASSIYEEFEHMIKKYDEEVVKELMPLIVGILEALDGSFSDKQENDVEIELLKEDNHQLLAQYDREKQLRKTAEQKLLEVEDAVEDDRKKTEEKVESLESLVRTLEIKGKNAADHVSRLEEREIEMKNEYTKLHERYTDLFKTHMDYLDRTKSMVYGEKGDGFYSPRGRGFVMPTLRPIHLHHQTVTVTETIHKPSHVPESVDAHRVEPNSDLLAQIESTTEPSSQSMNRSSVDCTDSPMDSHEFELISKREIHNATEEELRKTMADIVETTPELEDFDNASYGTSMVTRVRMSLTARNAQLEEQDSVFDELNQESLDVVSDVDDGADITGMGREVENLIEENAELLATKNALNIVKDDLIAQVDELTSEVEMVRAEVRSLRALTDRYKTRIAELEEHVKKQKEDLESKSRGDDDDESVPRAQRKRFTRVEMARVLMERNQYKERLMELQEAVRWTEMIRASREHPDMAADRQKQSRSGIWGFFSNLFGDSGPSETDKKLAVTPGKVKYSKGPGLPKHL